MRACWSSSHSVWRLVASRRGRFVQEQDVKHGKKRQCHGDALLLPCGELPDPALLETSELPPRQQVCDRPLAMITPGKQRQRFAYRQPGRQAVPLEHETQARAAPHPLLRECNTAQAHDATVGSQASGEDGQERALARPIGTEQHDKFSLV